MNSVGALHVFMINNYISTVMVQRATRWRLFNAPLFLAIQP